MSTLVGCVIRDTGIVGDPLVGRICFVFADGSISVSWNGSQQASTISFARIQRGAFTVELPAHTQGD